MTVINTNTAAINAQYNLSKVQSAMDDAMSALSSGKRITSAADDAAGLSIVTRMESQVRGLNQAMRNAADGQSMVDTAEGAMDEIANMLQRMRELALQAANGSNNLEDRNNLNAEVSQLQAEIDRVVSTTSFNNQTLLDGSYEKSLQIGVNAGETLSLDISNMSTAALGKVNGFAPIQATTSAEFSSTSDKVDTVAQITFNGDDRYDFKLTIGTDVFTITDADVENNSAENIVDKINKAMTDASFATRDAIQVEHSGNVVTITNELGTDIKISEFAADANSTASYVSLAGKPADELSGSEKLDNVTLGGANSFIGTSFQVGTETEAYQAATPDPDAPALSGSEKEIIDVKVETSSTAAAGAFLADTGATSTTFTMTVGEVTLTAAGTGFANVGALVTALQSDADYAGADFTIATGGSGIQVTFKEAGVVDQDVSLVSNYATALDIDGVVTTEGTNGPVEKQSIDVATSSTAAAGAFLTDTGATSNTYTLTVGDVELSAASTGFANVGALVTALQSDADYAGADFTIGTDSSGITVTFKDAGEVSDLATLKSDHTTPLNATATQDQVGKAPDSDVLGEGGSRLYLEFVGADTYNFELKDRANSNTSIETFELVYDGTEDGLDAIATVVGTKLGDGYTVAADDGVLTIIRNSGAAYRLDGFSSEGGGRIMAATDTATDTDGAGKLLEDNNHVTTATTSGIGAFNDTQVKLTVSSTTDRYSFTISDGTSTAHVKDQLGEDLAAAINYALDRAGMGGSSVDVGMTAATGGTGIITLTQKEGAKIEIDNFDSAGAGTMKAEKVITGSGASAAGQAVGFTMILDDGDGVASDAVRDIDISSISGAESALSIIDAALEDISKQRSDLGAISNRLDHTISNLGNIVVNTEAAQSRIEDADFAAETGNLTKAQILSQAATAMLAQANASKQSVLSLLQG